MVKFEQLSDEQMEELGSYLREKVYGSEGQSVADATQTFSQNDNVEEDDEFIEDEAIDEDLKEIFVEILNKKDGGKMTSTPDFLANEDIDDKEMMKELMKTITESISKDVKEQRMFKEDVYNELTKPISENNKFYLFFDAFKDNIVKDNEVMVIYVDAQKIIKNNGVSSALDLRMFDKDKVDEIDEDETQDLYDFFHYYNQE